MNLLIKLIIMAMVAVIPYTAPAFIQPASADTVGCSTGLLNDPVGCVVEVYDSVDPSQDPLCQGEGKCCKNHPNDPDCQVAPPPPVCPPSCGNATEPAPES